MPDIGTGAMALPLAVFEDREAPASLAGRGSSALPISSPSTDTDRVLENAPSTNEAGVQGLKKQPEVSNAPHGLAGSVMLLRSHQPSTSQPPPLVHVNIPKHVTGRCEDSLLPDDLLLPPSPRSMQILGKSKGLKRDQLESSQPTPHAKRPAVNPRPKTKARPQKGRAPVPSPASSPPQTAQPVGSNWWSQGSPGQPAQRANQQAPADPAIIGQDDSRWGHLSPAGTQYTQLSGQQDIASWQPAYPSIPPVPYHCYTRGSRQIPNDGFARTPAHDHAEAWPSSPPVSRRSTVKADQAAQQTPQQPVPACPGTGAQQQPQTARCNGGSQHPDTLGLHWINEVFTHTRSACQTNGSTQKQHSRVGAPGWSDCNFFPAHRPDGQDSGQHKPMHWQPQQPWPAPDGGRYILASPPVTTKQHPQDSPQAGRQPQGPAQQDGPSGGLHSRHAAPTGYPQALQGGLQQLHQEVERFAAMAAPTVAEIRAVQQAQSIITETALGIWPACTVGSFGSQANATALPGSDIDVTILGVMDVDGATGIKRQQRNAVKLELQKLLKALRKRGAVVGKPLIIAARVPIIKCTLAVSGAQIPADISLGVANGLSAVALVNQQALAIGPSMKALAVVLKALLQQARLNERVAGGLGSYCLLNLVMAHLMSQGVNAQSQYNLGHLLLSFLDWIGNTLDYGAKAVSVQAGGIVKKERHFKQKDRPMLLTIEDPQQPGTDIGSGAFNIAQTVDFLSKAHSKLRHAAQQWGSGAGRAGQAVGWAAVQAEGPNSSIVPGTNVSFPLLSSIMDPGLSLERTAQAAQARLQAAKQSMGKGLKRTPRTPKKRKLRDQPSHLRFEDGWSDTETSAPSRKKQKKQGTHKGVQGQAMTKTAKKLAAKKQSRAQSTKKQAKRKSFFMKALAKKGASHKAQHRKGARASGSVQNHIQAGHSAA